jgi:uncharacterized protein
MLFDLTKIHRDRARVERTFEPSAFDPQDEDYRVAAPVVLTMDVEKAGGDRFHVSGRVSTRLELGCGRCLEPFEIPVDAEFDLRYLPQSDNAGDGGHAGRAAHAGHADSDEREIAEDDLTTSFYQDGALDLADLVREQFELALPMKPLCSEGCRGLCPQCGTNLNLATCDCTNRWEDPRLAALEGLLDRQKEN